MALIGAKFELGQIVMTSGVEGWLAQVPERAGILARAVSLHIRGEWGFVDPGDAKMNDQAVKDGGRILSVYLLDPESLKPYLGDSADCFWIITEGEPGTESRVTTLLLPEEY